MNIDANPFIPSIKLTALISNNIHKIVIMQFKGNLNIISLPKISENTLYKSNSLKINKIKTKNIHDDNNFK